MKHRQFVYALLLAMLQQPHLTLAGEAIPLEQSEPGLCERLVQYMPNRRQTLVYGLNLLAAGVFIHLDSESTRQKLELFDEGVKENKPGARFLRRAVSSELLAPEEAVDGYLAFQEDLKNRLKPMRSRIHDFIGTQLWSMAAAMTAEYIINEVAAQYDSSMSADELNRRFTSHPLYPRLVEQVGDRASFTLRLWATPRLTYKGKSDVVWLKFGRERFGPIPRDEFLPDRIKEFGNKLELPQTASNFIDPNSR